MSRSSQPQTKEFEELNHLRNGVNGKVTAQPTAALDELDELMPRSQAGLRVSEEEYWQFYYQHLDFNYEWNDGILEEKPLAKVRGSQQYQWFLLLLNAYKETQPRLHIVNLEIGFRLPLSAKTTIRKPDLFIVLHDNPTLTRSASPRADALSTQDDDCTFKGICDVCVESLSDSAQSEIDRDMIYKRDEYAEVGVREYYILDCEGRYTTFYRTTLHPQTGKRRYELLPISDDGVVRSEVMPGFQFRLRDLYRQPSLEALVEDEVYRGYVWLAYQAQQQRADAAEARAEKAEARARNYADQLRALGLLEDEESAD